jgi:hypothetical protein
MDAKNLEYSIETGRNASKALTCTYFGFPTNGAKARVVVLCKHARFGIVCLARLHTELVNCLC